MTEFATHATPRLQIGAQVVINCRYLKAAISWLFTLTMHQGLQHAIPDLPLLTTTPTAASVLGIVKARVLKLGLPSEHVTEPHTDQPSVHPLTYCRSLIPMREFPDLIRAHLSGSRRWVENDARSFPTTWPAALRLCPATSQLLFQLTISPCTKYLPQTHTSTLWHTLVRSYLGSVCIFNCRPAFRSPTSPPARLKSCSLIIHRRLAVKAVLS